MLGNDPRIHHTMSGYILNPSKLNSPPQTDLIVRPQPQLTTVTTETVLGLLTGLGNK